MVGISLIVKGMDCLISIMPLSKQAYCEKGYRKDYMEEEGIRTEKKNMKG
jgi:hypothetical protein